MPYLLDQGQAAMLHMPKTGGTWAYNAMREAGVRVVRHKRQHEACMPDGADLIFCFVREPTDWLRSWWKHGARKSWTKFPEHWHGVVDAPTKRLWELAVRVGGSFGDFVEAYLAEMPGQVVREFERFTVACDLVGRTHTIRRDLALFLDYAGIDYDPDIIERSHPRNVGTKPVADYLPGQVERVEFVESAWLGL